MGSSTVQKAPYQGSGVADWFVQTAGVVGASTFRFDKTIDSTIEGHPVKQDVKITLTNKINNEAYNTFLTGYLSAKEVTTTKVTYEDGVVETVVSGTTSAKTGVVIWYDGTIPGGKVKVYVGAAVLSGATGNAKTVYGNIGDMPVEIQFVDLGTTITVPATAFDSAIVSQAALTLAGGNYGTVIFMTAA